jgi:hypothetical protein
MGSMQEYQRSPAKWEKTLNNLRKIDQLPDNIFGWLAFTVTAYNVNHMIDFMKWKLKDANFRKINFTNKRPIITHHVAHHPKHLNIRVLPPKYKEELTKSFEDFVWWVKDNGFNEHVVKQAEAISKGIISYMNSDNYYDTHWVEFVNYTNKLDQIRGESLIDVEPKFKEYLNG